MTMDKNLKRDGAEKSHSPVLVDSTSEDSDSLDHIEGENGSIKLMKILNVVDDKFRLIDFDARVGLNAAKVYHNFPCLLDEENRRFYVYLGDVSIEKFNKSTFMNLANFAEENGAKTMILI